MTSRSPSSLFQVAFISIRLNAGETSYGSAASDQIIESVQEAPIK